MRAVLFAVGFVLLVVVLSRELQSASTTHPSRQLADVGEAQSFALGGLGLILIGAARGRR